MEGDKALKESLHEVFDLTTDDEEDEVEAALDHHVEELEVGADYDEYTDDDGTESDLDSLSEDLVEALGGHGDLSDLPDACSAEEAKNYRRKLHQIGPQEFCRVTVEAGKITAKKLLTAFSIRPPPFLDDADDESYYGLLGFAIRRELKKRMKLDAYNSIADAVKLLQNSKNIIVLTGAGISTSLGIPDFRSKKSGLYPKLKDLGYEEPQDVFDIEVFREDPTLFYTIARDILPPPGGPSTTPTHAFIRLLQDKNKLLTNYSQNVDNIEAAAGINPEKLVQCHGSFATATCLKCGAHYDGGIIMTDLKAGRVARCPKCIEALSKEVPGMKRKRSHNGTSKKRQRKLGGGSDSSSESDNIPEPGVLKPDITFFGEALPDKFSDRLTKHDKDLVDLVIVIGTSLTVAPVSEIVPFLPTDIPQLIITRDRVRHVEFDIEMLGDCDVVVAELCRRLKWDLKHELIPKGQTVEVTNYTGTEEEPIPPVAWAHVFKEHV